MKRWCKNRINYLHFDNEGFYDLDNFVIKLSEILKENEQYSLLLKINYNKVLFGMVGKQIGFKISSKEDFEKFENLHKSLKQRLKYIYDRYEVEEVNSIQLLYVLIKDIPELKLKNINKLNFNNKFTNVKESKDRFNLIPLTTDMKYYGKLIINDRSLFLDIINKQRYLLNEDKLIINDNDLMYLYKDDLIIINIKEKDIYYRSVYNSVSGILICEIKDIIVNDDLFIRKIGNVSLSILKDSIITIESEKKLFPIKFSSKSLKDEPNPFIGSWDIEAFEDIDGYAKVYALGFTVLGGKVQTYYLNENITSEQLVLKCIDDMLVNEYNGYIFYTHNFGRYDSKFLIKILKEENLRREDEYYRISELSRGDKVLKLTIKVKRSLSDRMQSKIGVRKDPGFNQITIVDSLNLLNQSLDKLCHSFNVEVIKGKFPHSFVRRNTLNYVGNTPSYEYWENISLDEYNQLVKTDWSLRNECLKYLEKDLVSLVMIMNKFCEYINRKYHLQVTDTVTISRLALNIFLKDYLKDSKLPIIGRNMFSDIKQAYYGGVTEVYKPYGKNLLHYDVNSLYPFAALNPIPGINCSYIENIDRYMNLNDLFGFFYCEIEAVDGYFGLLPVHNEEGLIMPNGSWKGWYFSEELKYASKKGYKINVINGYNFNKIHHVFTEYVKDLYNIKSTTKDEVEKDIAKRLLNHLLGRFGLNIVKPITKCVNEDELSLIWSTREIIGKPVKLTDYDYWLTYNPQIDREICEEHGVDYIKVCNLTSKTDIEKLNEFRDVSLTTAAAVTAYARIYMSEIKESILEKGGKIYYTDTDSIVTDIPIDDNLIGNELGKFKLEYKIKQGYYISNKTYYVDLSEKKFDTYLNKYISSVIKSKTVKNDSLTLDSFKELYKGNDTIAVKRSAITDYNKGSVLIRDDNVDLRHDSFTKRQKVYKRGKWVDTKPLILNNNINEINIKKKTNIQKWKCFLRIYDYIKLILDSIFWGTIIGIFIFIYVVVNSDENDNNSSLNELLELGYEDDYMEEPIDYNVISSDNKNLSLFNKFINLFTESGCYKKYKTYNICVEKVNSDINLNCDKEDIMSNIYIDYIKKANQEIEKLEKQISLLEIECINYRIAALDAINTGKKALKVYKELE